MQCLTPLGVPESNLEVLSADVSGFLCIFWQFVAHFIVLLQCIYCGFIVFYKKLSPSVYHWKLQSANQVLLTGNSFEVRGIKLHFKQITECISIAGEVKAS